MKIVQIIGLAGMIAFLSCCKSGCKDSLANNYDEKVKKDDGSCTYGLTYDVPETYLFEDTNGHSTVSFSGQKERLDMLSEITTYLKTANTKGTELDASILKNMFSNDSYTWSDANGLGMTGSSKQLKNKCAGGDEVITNLFESYMDSITTLSKLNQDGSAGLAGVYANDGVKGPYLMDANGVEYTQWIEKGLMASVFYYQITVGYLGDDKMNVDNSTAVDEGEGKYYTTMEHHWDEAYGYFTSETDYPVNGTDRFFGKYAEGREDLLQSQTKLSEAFRTGRAAIANEDLDTRDEQRIVIKDELEKVIAATAIHYLNEAIENIAKETTRNHVLSEATAFVDALRYGANVIDGNSISISEINSIISTIGSDYNNVTAANLQSARNELSTIYSMDSIKEQL